MSIKSWIYNIKNNIVINRKRHKIRVASLEDTIDKIIEDKCSISRFGDGELYIMEGRAISFQKADTKLSERLKEVIKVNEEKHLICVSNALNPKNYKEYTDNHVKWLKNHFKYTIGLRLKYLSINKKYYNMLLSRFWIPFKDKERAKRIAAQLKDIWKDRDVVVIEGEKTRMGVGNDLLSQVKSCQRIICPSKDAFDKYEEILETARKLPKDRLILIALGPTATVLAYDLFKLGFQALDIGHIDLEYEWMRLNATEKVNLKNKFVNELSGGEETEECLDEKYISEIIYRCL